jgi:copper chaperone CopZ
MTCTLCGLDSGTSAFCCAGCENVYAILLESGVIASGQNFRETELFQQSLRLGLISNRAEAPPPIPEGTEVREAVFHVRGMWCTSCGWLIEHALARTRGVQSAEVLFASDLLKVRYCPQYLPQERIVERVDSLGYHAAEYSGPSDAGDSERKDLLLRTGIAAFLSMNAMMFSLVVYASYFEAHQRLRPLHSLRADGDRHAVGLLLRGAHSAHRLGGRAYAHAAHGIAARHRHHDDLWV